MVKRKLRVLDMLNALGKYYKKNQAVLDSSPALKAVFVIFVARLFELNGWVEFTEKEISGITTNKKELKKMLATEIAMLAGQAHSWAFHNGDIELMKATGYKDYELARMPDSKMDKTCGAILKVITSRNEGMGDHQIEKESLNYAADLLDLFRGKTPDKRNAVASRSATLKNSNKEIAYLNNMLDESIDGLMLRIKKNHPAVYDEYLVNREVLESGSRETKVSGEVSGPDGAPLIKAQAEAVEVEKGTIYKAFTNGKGIFDLKIPEAGRYKLVVICGGFSSFTSEPFDISPGDQLKINVTLKP